MRSRLERRPCRIVFSLLVVSILTVAGEVGAQWSSNPAVNTPICIAPLGQLNSVAASDGAGGAIVVWVDNRNGLNSDIYVQHVNAAGVATWGFGGNVICNVPGDQLNPAILADGAGGAVIVWQDFRNGVDFNLFAQRVNAAGVIQWGLNGIPLCAGVVGDQIWPMLIDDGAGGSIVTWEDERAGPGAWDIYAQRMNGAGVRQWVPVGTGIPISLAVAGQFMPMLVTDAAGGAIITWYDFRNGANDDIYAQRVNGLGAVLWPVNGVQIIGLPGAPDRQTQPTIAIDGAGGAIITWYDFRNGIDWQIFAQRVNNLGVLQWPLPARPVCTIPNDQVIPKIISDGAGGAIITWYDFRNGIDNDIYAQRLNAAGLPVWPFNGVGLCVMPGNQELPKIVSDGAGGAIISWNDSRNIINWDIYAQRVTAAGILQWAGNGVAISSAPNDQTWPFQFFATVEDGSGGAIISWQDLRNNIDTDIYVQNVNNDGTLGSGPLAYWRLEDGAGITAADVTGNGHTASFSGTPAWVTDVPCSLVAGQPNASSLEFAQPGPPTTPALEIPDSPTLRPTNGITVEAWIRPVGPGVIISKQFYQVAPIRDVSSFDLREPNPVTGAFRFALSDASGVESEVVGLPGVIAPNRWTHLAGTWDSASQIMRLYVDFVEVASGPFAGPIAYDASPAVIGAEDFGAGGAFRAEYFYGDIDEVRIYDRALTPVEMLQTSCGLPPRVMVYTPAPNDTLVAGSNADITWVALDSNGIASVMIEVTTDGTTSYDTLATGEPNDSSFTWVVPPTYSDQCQVRITALDGLSNESTASSPGYFHIVPGATGIVPRGTPPRLSLALYPNPFNPTLTLTYSVPASGPVEVAIFDVQGRRVATLVNEAVPAGEHSITWNGRDAKGAHAASGIYFVRLLHRGRTQVRKTVLLK